MQLFTIRYDYSSGDRAIEEGVLLVRAPSLAAALRIAEEALPQRQRQERRIMAPKEVHQHGREGVLIDAWWGGE